MGPISVTTDKGCAIAGRDKDKRIANSLNIVVSL
jgi:hypothetical protein